MKKNYFILFIFLSFFSCQTASPFLQLSPGIIISESTKIQQDTFFINGVDSLNQAVIIIEGDNLEVDFNNAVLVGSNDKEIPNEFYGTAILVRNSKNVTIKNAIVRGYKVGIMAENVDSLKILDSDLSYNYRQKLKSIREREDLSDWLSYHENDKDEWLRYGAGIYLKNCKAALVEKVKITGGQNGLMMTNCNDGYFYNNEFHFNSGIGIGLYRSSRNQVLHNKLDWNVRGYSHGFYQRGQDSAGILVYEQSSENTFAFNSATHSGDGFFLWAGQTTMDTGEGGCNGNDIRFNDFSHAPTNGIEITFSENHVFGNIMHECRYGVWGGYSKNSNIMQNDIRDCDYGVAFEHGHEIQIHKNYFENVKEGIKLWERTTQPSDWGFAKKTNIKSQNYTITENHFSNVKKTLNITNTEHLKVRGNLYFESESILPHLDKALDLEISSNVEAKSKPLYPFNYSKNSNRPYKYKQFDDMGTFLPKDHPRGRKYILVNEWGPYDFRYPVIWLRKIEGNEYTFLLLGPTGNWKAVDGIGIKRFGPKTGTFPATIVAEKDPDSDEIALNLEFIGEAITDQFGKNYKKGKPFPFSFYRYQKTLNWQVNWYEFSEATHPEKNYAAFKNLKNQKPHYSEATTDLAYTWWRSPGNEINPDQFGTFASTTFEIEPGNYKISITSDDGLKLFLDGKLLIDHWDIHVPATDEIVVKLGGKHYLEIEHFEGGGFATLSFNLELVSSE